MVIHIQVCMFSTLMFYLYFFAAPFILSSADLEKITGHEMQFGRSNEQGLLFGPGPAMMHQALDAGQLIYYSPGFQPEPNSYCNSFLPGAVFGVDGQYLGQQPYGSCPITPHPQPFGSPVYFPNSMCYGPEMMPTYGQDASFWDYNNGNGYTGSLTLPTLKSKYPSKTQPSRHTTASSKSPIVEKMGLPPVLDNPPRADLQNPLTKSPNNKVWCVLCSENTLVFYTVFNVV